MSNIIKVPKPRGTTYNPNRPLEKNLLIRAQVKHFFAAEQQLPSNLKTRHKIENIRTEGQASVYIRKVTKALHKRGALPAPKVERA